MNDEFVTVGTTFDVAVFENGLPVVLVTLVQDEDNIVRITCNTFGPISATAFEQLVALVVDAINKHGDDTSDDEDMFSGAADFDLPF